MGQGTEWNVGRVSYRERREAKAGRLREWAEKREAKADAARVRADELAGLIPFGQPVLVGHHSEGRHRRDLDRIHSAYGQEIENRAKAAEFRRRADGIERQAERAVYSDDPDAAERLRSRIAELEEKREAMKAANAAARKGVPWVEGLSAELRSEAETNLRHWPGGTDVPFPTLKNLTANVRRLRKRLEELEVG